MKGENSDGWWGRGERLVVWRSVCCDKGESSDAWWEWVLVKEVDVSGREVKWASSEEDIHLR